LAAGSTSPRQCAARANRLPVSFRGFTPVSIPARLLCQSEPLRSAALALVRIPVREFKVTPIGLGGPTSVTHSPLRPRLPTPAKGVGSSKKMHSDYSACTDRISARSLRVIASSRSCCRREDLPSFKKRFIAARSYWSAHRSKSC
jgi:hypothetical protein